MTERARLILLLCATCLACAEDGARRATREPAGMAARPSQPAAAPAAPEPPIGSMRPTARIVGLQRAATGAPATLGDISDSVDFVTVVARGPGAFPLGAATVQLHLDGIWDTTLVERVAPPVPVIIAHKFRLVVASTAAAGVRPGGYQVRVRLVDVNDRVRSESPPLHVQVRAP